MGTQKNRLNETVLLSIWDTDSNKSFDFLLNPICIVVVLYSVFCVACILVIYYTNKIKFKPNIC